MLITIQMGFLPMSADDTIKKMTAIRVIFDGKAFIPQQTVSLPAQERLDAAVRAYYQAGNDAEDDAWANATSAQSHRAWDED